MKSAMKSILFGLLVSVLIPSVFALEPLISRKGALLFEDRFDGAQAKPEWKALHGTRWQVEGGAYKGIPSTVEFQSSRDNHTGATPSMTLQVGARETILEMSFRLSGDLKQAHIGWNEGPTSTTTGHIFRLLLGTESGVSLQKDRNSQIEGDKDQITVTSDWKLESDRWYTVMLETQGEEVVAQVAGGPTLIMKHARLDVPKAWGNFKARGQKGNIEYDDVQVWESLPLTLNRSWKKHTIVDAGKSMVNSAVTSDFDGDGHRDVIASYGGRVMALRGPDWTPYALHEFSVSDSRNRPRDACIHSCLLDVDGDGDQDFVGSNNTVFWLECPDDPFSGKPWKYRTVDDEIQGTHCLITGDVDGDDRLDLIANSSRSPQQTKVPESVVWLETPKDLKRSDKWTRHVFADKDAPGASHYFGLGDVNGDGRPDIAGAAKGGLAFPGGEWFAYWEQPEDPRQPWEKHLLSEGEIGASNILPGDLDGDGAIDFLTSRGHGVGVFWYQGRNFEAIPIDPKIIGPHSLILEDLDGDGDLDIAACGHFKTGVVAWYENDGQARFTKHVIDVNQGSYDMRAEDMDGDGDLDFLIAGHWSANVVWYENSAK